MRRVQQLTIDKAKEKTNDMLLFCKNDVFKL